MAPLAPDLYKVEFTADADTYRALCQARELLRHQIPDGNAAEVIGLALKLLVEKLAQQKLGGRKAKRRAVAASARESKSGACAAADHGAGVPARPASRHIPVGVKRQVWARDQGRCAFVGAKGRRCTERGMLEFHHVMPFAVGGPATLDNIEIRCRAHNAHEAEVRFGSRHVADRMKSGKLPAPEQLEYVMSAPPI